MLKVDNPKPIPYIETVRKIETNPNPEVLMTTFTYRSTGRDNVGLTSWLVFVTLPRHYVGLVTREADGSWSYLVSDGDSRKAIRVTGQFSSRSEAAEAALIV